jgi:hypothetical protein
MNRMMINLVMINCFDGELHNLNSRRRELSKDAYLVDELGEFNLYSTYRAKRE